MADKIIIWEISIGGMWVEVTERSFLNTMRMLCDHAYACGSHVLFINKEGYEIGKMYFKEV